MKELSHQPSSESIGSPMADLDERRDITLSDRKLDILISAITSIGKRLDKIDSRLDKMEDQIIAVKDAVHKVELNLIETKSSLESKITEVKTGLESKIAETKSSLENKIMEIKGDIKLHSWMIGAILATSGAVFLWAFAPTLKAFFS